MGDAPILAETLRRGMARRTLRLAVMCLGLLAALVTPVYALALGLLWLAVRIFIYATSDVREAEIVGWLHDERPKRGADIVATPNLRFVDRHGRSHTFHSTLTVYLDRQLEKRGVLPEGPLPVRYRAWPFYAEVDDKGLWFTLPGLWIGFAVFGAMMNWFFRAPLLRWLGW